MPILTSVLFEMMQVCFEICKYVFVYIQEGMFKQLQCHRYQLACMVETNKSCVGECIIARVTNLVTALLIIHNRSLKGLVWLAVDLVDLCRMHLLISLCVHTCLDHCLLYCFVSARIDVQWTSVEH